MLLADVNLGEILWTTLAFFFIFMYLMILFRILGDLFSDHDTSGWAKAAWVLFLVLVPFLTAFIYLIARGDGMARSGPSPSSSRPRPTSTTTSRPRQPGHRRHSRSTRPSSSWTRAPSASRSSTP